ncbi:hypothetical protein H5410_035289 [Solanum commersonii]|uniref:Prephenate/arogenate dehydrogenase domain-containing protein n=1 Tax=Solanum commersonii TaxID=4109 RepID=A0A9J5Y0T8_SOLCO|nr:hypothetical protein H5410_035289 [Solanum commersonii]
MLSFTPLQSKPTPTSNSNRFSNLTNPTTSTSRRRRFSVSSPSEVSHHRGRRRLSIKAIDAAQPYDYEALVSNQYAQSGRLKIGIVGFGNFGQFLAKSFVTKGHVVLAHSRTDYSQIANSLGVSFFQDPHDLCEQHPDVIVLCTSIISTETVLRSLPIQRLKRNTLFVDVLSVKEFPKNIFLQVLPTHFDILCTHPMFGPESGKDSWKDLIFMFDKVRIGEGRSRTARVDKFLDIFEKEGCRMVPMTCAEHDKHAAGSQFITHTMGRVLEKLCLESTPINTKGYETLLNLVDNTASDSFDLYYGLFMYNKNAMEELERLDLAFEALKKELFGHLHDLLRKQLFGKAEEAGQRRVLTKLPRNGYALPAPSSDATCWPQVFVLPKRIMKLINGICRTFVCSDVVLSKRARVFQEKICLSKAAGGLKVMHLISWNRAAILKHSWAIAETLFIVWLAVQRRFATVPLSGGTETESGFKEGVTMLTGFVGRLLSIFTLEGLSSSTGKLSLAISVPFPDCCEEILSWSAGRNYWLFLITFDGPGRSSPARLPNMAVCASQVLQPKDTCFWQNGVKFEGGI